MRFFIIFFVFIFVNIFANSFVNSTAKEEKNSSSYLESSPSSKKTPSAKKNKKNHFLVEFRPSYFYYQEKVFRKIFNNGDFIAIFGFDFKTYKKLHAWIDVGYLHDKGTVKMADNATTKLTLIPISFGLKFEQPINKKVSLYTKIGPNRIYVKSKTKYPYVIGSRSKTAWGGTVGIGSLVSIGLNFSLNIFADYLYTRKSFIDPNSNIKIRVFTGGLAVGGGLGYNF